jgi:class 3 adenylate cyclase
MEADTRYVNSQGVSIAYQLFGEGPRDIVIPMPFISHVEHSWEWPPIARMLRRFGSLGRVAMFNQRGFGMSDAITRPASLDDRVDDIAAVIDAAGMVRPVLLALSDSTPGALLFAATHPEEISGLVLYSAYARRTRGVDYPWGITREQAEASLAGLADIWGTGTIGAMLAPEYADDPQFRRWSARLERLASGPGTFVDQLRATLDIDIRDVLPLIRLPTLVAHHAGDPFYPAEGGRFVAERIPGARFVVLPGDSHSVFVNGETLVDTIEEFLTGSRRTADPNRVLATVLFTDIVDSTSRLAALGDKRWGELLERHNTLVRRAIDRFRGSEIKTTGDGFLVIFDGPTRAVHAAAAIVGEARGLGLRLRAGLHTGECDLVGADVAGLAVHVGARVSALAGADEILMTGSVRDLLAEPQLELEDHGRHTLKGVPGEWRLFRLMNDAAELHLASPDSTWC